MRQLHFAAQAERLLPRLLEQQRKYESYKGTGGHLIVQAVLDPCALPFLIARVGRIVSTDVGMMSLQCAQDRLASLTRDTTILCSSRADDDRPFGGWAIRTPEYLLAFAGLGSRAADEALLLMIVCTLDLLTYPEVQQLARLSENPYVG